MEGAEGVPGREMNVDWRSQRELWRKAGGRGRGRVPEKSGPPAFPPHMVTTGSLEASTGLAQGRAQRMFVD